MGRAVSGIGHAPYQTWPDRAHIIHPTHYRRPCHKLSIHAHNCRSTRPTITLQLKVSLAPSLSLLFGVSLIYRLCRVCILYSLLLETQIRKITVAPDIISWNIFKALQIHKQMPSVFLLWWRRVETVLPCKKAQMIALVGRRCRDCGWTESQKRRVGREVCSGRAHQWSVIRSVAPTLIIIPYILPHHQV